jgi:hypothetical protein
MADGNVTLEGRKAVGRPRKARGAANSSDAADARWTVPGVPLNVRNIATKASENNGMTVGDWLAEAFVAYSRSDRSGVSADGEKVSADGGANVPAIPLSGELKDLLDEIQNRLAAVESAKPKPLLSKLFGRQGAGK